MTNLDAAIQAARAREPIPPPPPPPKTNGKAPKKPLDAPLPPARTIGEVIALEGGLEPYLAAKHRQGVMSPWLAVNEATGGLHAGELIVVAGGTGKGKTDFSINYSLFAARSGVGVAFFSLEMSEPEIADRFICLAGSLNRTDFKNNFYDLNDLQPHVDHVAELPLYIIDCTSLTLETLQHCLIELRKRANIGMVVCDYLQLMSSPRRFENRVQEITALSRGLKLTAKETGLPFLVLSQLTRSSGREKRPPELYDLRDSGSIEQDSNVVIFIHGKTEYKDKPDTFVPVEVIIAKQRNGSTGRKINMVFGPNFGRFEQK